MNTEEIAEKIGAEVLKDIMNGKGETEILKNYGISEFQFSKIKKIILQQVKDKIDSTEITTHAVRYFKTLVKDRSFATKTQEYGLTDPQQKLLYNVARGNFRATYGIIFALRNIISPSQWIYREDEELPQPVKFNPIVSYSRLSKRSALYSISLLARSAWFTLNWNMR